MNSGKSIPLLPEDERYDLRLPGFTRIAWVSDEQRDIWKPRLRQIAKAWHIIEWLSVAEGLRRCYHNRYSSEQYASVAGDWIQHNLISLPLGVEPAPNQPYTDTVPTGRNGGETVTTVVVARALEDLNNFRTSWDEHDHCGMGRLLGFPECCIAFFQSVWVEAQCVDTTWPMMANSAMQVVKEGKNKIVLNSGYWRNNVLMRWLGIRAVPHLPCRVDCQASHTFSETLISLARDNGFAQEMDWLEELLGLPLEWSALHGIAEIRTPIAKVVTRTDATVSDFVVQVQGTYNLQTDVRGTRFPYNLPVQSGQSTQESGGQCIRPPKLLKRHQPDENWMFQDNGFKNMETMQRLHRPIVELVHNALVGTTGNIMDLGCGNGALLRTICQTYPKMNPYGIEVRAEALAHVPDLHPGYETNFILGDMFTPGKLPDDTHFALTILMAGRLTEVSPEQADIVKRWFKTHTDQILIYLYPDWSSYSLAEVAQKIGLTIVGNVYENRYAMASIEKDRNTFR